MNDSDDKNSDEFESLNQEILKSIQISSQENMLIRSLEKFYLKEENINIILPIINGESNISMRLIDYFVTNYSKKHRVTYNLEDNCTKILFNVYSSYKSQLKAYNKKYFDPFSRGNRIPFFLPNDCIITTIVSIGSRDKMVYDEYNWYFTAPLIDLDKGTGENSFKLPTVTCIGETCCEAGTIWNDSTKRCDPQVSSTTSRCSPSLIDI